jgi:hypothetical protein
LSAAFAQSFTQRGFLESGVSLYPQTVPGDSSLAIDESLFRYEAFYRVWPAISIAGGLDARFDTHQEAERAFGLSWWDRGARRPAFEVRRLGVTYTRGKFALVAGKQFIRWGKTDILNPTDRFAPRDYVNLVDNDFLGVTAIRATYGTASDTLDAIFEPRLTPSRMPLLGQRWFQLPAGLPVTEQAPDFPGGPQYGARWNHIGALAEYSLSFYNGFDNLPLYASALAPSGIAIRRYYPRMRMYGGDLAVPLAAVTLKAEAGYFTSATPSSDEYALYVVQLDRQAGEWNFAGGYAGQLITRHGVAPVASLLRGSTRAFVAHAGYTIDVNRSVSFETVIRQNGAGAYFKPEYTQAFGQHWRVTAGFVLIRGQATDFLGQYHANSHAVLTVRYSF